MKKAILSLMIFAFIISACYREEVREASFDESLVVSRDTMELILLDLHLMEGAYIQQRRESDRADILPNAYFQVLLKKYDITREEFDESMKYYTYHIDEMDKIFEEVINELGKVESELNMSE